MASLKAIFCAGVLALGAVEAAQAADLLPPPPPVEPIAPASFGNWYIRGDVGVGVSEISEAHSVFNPTNSFGNPPPASATRVTTALGDSALAGIGVGYQVNNWIRFDATGEYRTSANYRATNIYYGAADSCFSYFCQDSYSAQVSSGVFLLNGYVDLGTWYGVTPFVGAGVGGAIHRFSDITDASNGYGRDTSKTNLAWQVTAGLGFNVTPNLKLEISYRYLDMGKLTSGAITCGDVAPCWFERQTFHLASNDIRIGFRYMFADYIPSAPPLRTPLITKY